MHRNLMPVALALAASLSACGGGGSGGPSSLPAPPPEPPAEPPTNDTLTDLTFDQTFATALSTLAIGAGSDGVAITSTSKPYGTGISVAYDASSDSYTPSQGAVSGLFGPGDITEATSDSTGYEVADGSQSDIFIRFNAGAGNTTLQLTYASYGGWLDSEDMPDGISLAARFFVYGIETADSDMPRSGTA